MKLLSPTPASAAVRTRKVAPARLPYPDIPDYATARPFEFWLTVWQCALAKHEALEVFTKTAATVKASNKDNALEMALIRAQINSACEVSEALGQVRVDGGLLFAFLESTKFRQGTPCA